MDVCESDVEMAPVGVRTLVFLWTMTLTWTLTSGSTGIAFTKHTQWQGVIGPTNLRSYGLAAGQYHPGVDVFKGIPYASAPVAQLRYESPAPIVLQMNKTYFANESRPACPKHFETLNVYRGPDSIRRIMSDLKQDTLEDCLYLDIYAPRTSQKSLPVLVYANSHADDPEDPFDGSSMAAIGNIIVVSFRYRVGILGFLHPGYSEDIRGNFGLWDQLAALQWIRENIEGFGGDENNVSLMGFDMDAAFVGILALSPLSQAYGGLFHRLILLNGSPLSPLSINHRPLVTTTQMARALSCPIHEMGGELGRCLRQRPLDQLLGVAHNIGFNLFNNPFAPSVDGTMVRDIIGNVNSIYADEEALKELLGRYDMLCGLAEGTILPNIGQPSSLWQNLDLDEFVTAVLKLALQLEPGTEPKETLRDDLKRALINQYGDPYPYIRDILADYLTVFPMTNLLNLHSQTGKNTFFYVSKNNNPLGKLKNNDISYIFTSSVYKWKYIDYGQPNVDLQPYELLITFIANFVRSGDPNVQNPRERFSTAPRISAWPKYRAEKGSFLRFGRDVVVESKYRRSSMEFWLHEFPAILRNSLTSEQLNERDGTSVHTARFPLHFPKHNPGLTRSPSLPPNSESETVDEPPPVITSMFQSSLFIGCTFLLVLNFLCFCGLFVQRQSLKRLRQRSRPEDPPATTQESPANVASHVAGDIPSPEGSQYGYLRQAPAAQPASRAPRPALDTLSETETDNGFGTDFLGPNYDPRTKVTRWMFQQNRNDSGGDSFDRQDGCEGIPMTTMGCPMTTMGCPMSGGTLPRGHVTMTTALVNQSPYYNQPFQPSIQSDIPYADSRATTPSVLNFNYAGQAPPSGFNNNLTTNNFNNPRRSFIPSPSNSGTTTMSNADSQQHQRRNKFFPLLNNTVIVQEVDLEDFPNGDSGLVVSDDLEVQSSRPKLVPVRNTGTLTRSVGVGGTSNGHEGDDSTPLLPGRNADSIPLLPTRNADSISLLPARNADSTPLLHARNADSIPLLPARTADNPSSSTGSRQGQKVTFADEIL